MNAASSQLASFYLLGQRPPATVVEDKPAGLQPALFGGFHDLTGLRHDFPLVLVTDGPAGAGFKSLAAIIDELLRELAPPGKAGEPMRRQVLSLEQELRSMVARGNPDWLSTLWDAAQDKLLAAAGKHARKELSDNLRKAREAVRYLGWVVGCDGQLPTTLLSHVWSTARQAAARRLGDRIEYLKWKLGDLLRVDLLHSEQARDAQHLEHSMGASDHVLFDFQRMAEVLATVPVGAAMPQDRRRRIQHAIAVLESQRFVTAGRNSSAMPRGKPVFRFEFDSCSKALAAFRKRLPDMAELIRAISIAELEIANHYDADQHDRFFNSFSAESLSAEDIALFPSYLVCLAAGSASATQQSMLLDILGSGLPFKVLMQSDDILGDLSVDAGALAFGVRGAQLASMALGLNGVFVLQAAASSLYRLRAALLRGLAGHRPGLFSIYSGVNSDGVEPYLKAAAATESRAFPCFVFDPDAGADRAARFSLEGNPQVAADWPSHPLDYEDSEHKRQCENVSFTLADHVAGDWRHAAHVATVASKDWHQGMVAVDAFLELGDKAAVNTVPYVWVIDQGRQLQRAIVDQRLVDGARRCRDQWRGLQELGGIHNSHATALLAQARQAWQQEKEQLLADRQAADKEMPAAPAVVPATVAAPQDLAANPAQGAEAAAAQVVTAPAPAPVMNPDQAWIESIRCTSCNECTGINKRMFAYDEDQRAYIADADAGTYRQLVEAAESCQVCIIHPGKPRNPDEPGLDELMQRAEPFI
jgi:hypothetical protein